MTEETEDWPNPEHQLSEAQCTDLFRRAMGESHHKAEQRRRIINRHKVACNDLEGMDPGEIERIRAAAERRARRGAKK